VEKKLKGCRMDNASTISTSGFFDKIALITKSSDAFMAFMVIGILLIMIIPLPPIVLDFLLTLSITVSLIILLVGMYIAKPLEFSAFPSILLLVTLFRLSLNIASTRMILLHGSQGPAAVGEVIKSFGTFVVGGNYVVGLIVFIILVVINFVVITKGAGRIAEVAARFTLDAMPGKQMSIDADLNAGLIDDKEAKRRRREIASEAEYYGAMDGANKFVRGDAIAGIIITMVNILAGLAIGIVQNDMGFSDAAKNYTLLTVGDGLVSQIPALMVSTAAGLIVSRTGSDANLGSDISAQLFLEPKPIFIASFVLAGFGLVPGLPTIPFLILAAIAAGAAYFLRKQKASEKMIKTEVETETAESEVIDYLPPIDALALEVGLGLIPYVDERQDGELLHRIRSIRKQIAKDIGIIVPSVHIQDNLQLPPGNYRIFLKGIEIASGSLMVNYLLAMNSNSNDDNIKGIPTKEPTYGLPAFWIKEIEKENVLSKGYTVVNLPTVMATHLSDIMRRFAHEYVGRQEIQNLLDKLKQTHPKVVEELVPNLLPLGVIVKVIQNLLQEQVPVRDFPSILEALADWAPMTKDAHALTEYTRQALARTISHQYQSDEGKIYVVTLDHYVERLVSESQQRPNHANILPIDPDMVQKIIQSLSRAIEKFSSISQQPVVLCSPQIRYHFKKLTEQFVPDLVVLSFNELLSNLNIHSLGTVGISNANKEI
jgi:flagellar biosynthesis protein FlhA